ncbi:MAG: UDP-N-acetylmuramoyl-L-alanine--D-glutamate ligase [Pseudomonadota bacterium]
MSVMNGPQEQIIVGLGVTGLSCVRYLASQMDPGELRVVDSRSAPPGLAALQADFPEVRCDLAAVSVDYRQAARVVLSPGVALDDPLLAGLPAEVPVVSDIDLFCEAAAAPILAVTGTNGKSTVTSLVGHLLTAAGRKAVAGGNLGEPALDLLDLEAEVYVLELSSFQLERTSAHHFLAATILNLTEDHLDRHGDMAAYLAAKQRIYRDCELAVVHRGESATYPPAAVPFTSFGGDAPVSASDWGVRQEAGERWLVRGLEPVLPTRALPIAGTHNELNVLAAMAMAAAAGAEPEALARGAESYQGLPHRCERVRERQGVAYVNDSKATNVGATEAALAGLGATLEGDGRIVLIAGGDGKGADFRPLQELVRRHVRALVLLGRDAPALAAALGSAAVTHAVADLDEAVATAAELAGPGDLVLLSPACASLDMYPNFAARGEHFTRAVEALAA